MAAESLLLSLGMIVKNEEKNIGRCLESVQNIVDEIVILDTGSTDQTISIAKTFGAKICCFPWSDDFSAARNEAMRQTMGQWILILDADEYLDRTGTSQLRQTLRTAKEEGFFISIYNYQGTDRINYTRAYSLRLFRNHPTYRYEGKVHEQILPSILKTNPQALIGWSPFIIHHDGYGKAEALARDKGERNLKILLRQSPDEMDRSFYNLNLALEYIRLGKIAEAEIRLREGWEKVNRQASYAHYLLLKLIACLHQQKKDREAIIYCRQGLEFYPGFADILYYYGICLLKTGATEEAKYILIRGLQQGGSPRRYISQAGCGSYFNLLALGQIEEQAFNFDAALDYYLQAFRLQPHQLPYLKRLIKILLKCNLDKKTYLAKNNLLNGETILTIVRTAYTMNHYSLVLEILSDWRKVDTHWELRLIEGQSLMRLGQYQEAIARIRTIPQLCLLPKLQKDTLFYSWLCAVLQDDFQLAQKYTGKLKECDAGLSNLLSTLQDGWQAGLQDGILLNPGETPEAFRNNESVLALLEIIDNLAACRAIKLLNTAIAFILQIAGEDFIPLLLKIIDKHHCHSEILDHLKTCFKNADEEAFHHAR